MSVHEDRRRPSEAGGLGLLSCGDESVLDGQVSGRGDLGESVVGDLPMGAAVEAEQLDLHLGVLEVTVEGVAGTVRLPVDWKVKGGAMRIGALAGRTAVSTKTIRFWESEGLVPEPGRTPSGYRDYDDEAADRIDFIRHAQTAGLTLAQIRQILDVSDDGAPPCEHVAAAVADRLAEVETRIAELQRTRAHLRHLARRADDQDPADCEGFCSIIPG